VTGVDHTDNPMKAVRIAGGARFLPEERTGHEKPRAGRWISNRRRAHRLGTWVLLGGILTACSRDPLTGPPELRVGRDECAECGMLIADDRFAAAILIERAGRREHTLYDDLGCMLDHERKTLGEGAIVDRFVRDYDTRAWLRATDAAYALVDEKSFPTPMGSGLLAVQDRTRAEELARRYAGKALDYADLLPARRAWLKDRYGEGK
jgi:copper chaperone NosL